MRVLLTGGAGYIGSHTAVALLEQGHDVVIVDDLSNSHFESVKRVEALVGKTIDFVKGDLTDAKVADACFESFGIDAVVHFAGLKSVSESVTQPLRYYGVNIGSTLNVLAAMKAHSVDKMVFSSSATVYGLPQASSVDETHRAGFELTNPYGRSKSMNEQIIRDVAATIPEFAAVNLRYFNPIGAHASGRIGEDPAGIPTSLMPFIAQVAVGRRKVLSVFGDDYDTPDGTGVRDYIHVMDLAEGHVAALTNASPGVKTYNLGTGRGTSVLEAVRAFEAVSGRDVAYEIAQRRDGDLARVIADPTLAKTELGWESKRSFETACLDAWNWQAQNPHGYVEAVD